MPEQKKHRLKDLPLNFLIPNMITLLALAAGLTSIRFALQERWEHAVLAIAVAAIFDTLDGRVARLLKGASKFGAELDSLSDFACFGVAPAIILYLWTMQETGPVGWIFVIVYTMCVGLRLARFNVALEDESAPLWKKQYFTGVPAPAGACLVLLPLVLSFNLGEEIFRHTWVVAAFLLCSGGMLVSAIPTYSFKKSKIPPTWILPMMLSIVIIAALITTIPWATASAITIAYIMTIPFSYRSYKQKEINDDIVKTKKKES